MLHFIWVFTVCQCTCLGVSRIQRVSAIFFFYRLRCNHSISFTGFKNKVLTKFFLTENDVRKLNVPANTVVSLTLWDIPGREDMDIHKSYFRNLDAAIGKFLLEISTAREY